MSAHGIRQERVGSAYDTIAREYAAAIRDELDTKPIDRALLRAVVEMTRGGRIADIGCGPGHVAGYLAELGADVIGIDLSRSMIEIAGADHPEVPFSVQSMTALSEQDHSLTAAVLLYSIIHLTESDRNRAFEELHRVLEPGGIALLSFHIRSDEFQPGESNTVTTWFGHSINLEGHFLDPDLVINELMRAQFDIVSITTRMPHPKVEFPSERAYVLAQKPGLAD